MHKSTGASDRRAHAAVHRFVEYLDDEIEDAVNSARGRQLAAIKRIEQTIGYLRSCCPTDQASKSRKPRGLVIEPEFILAIRALGAGLLASIHSAIHAAITVLEPHEGVPFARKVIGKVASAKAGPEQTALAALERAGHDLVGLFRDLEERLAASCTTKTLRSKAPQAVPSGMFTPPQIAKQLGVSPDKVLAWIRKGELHATNVATGCAGRPRYKISAKDLADFHELRQSVKPPPKPARRRRNDSHVIEFFK